MLTVGKLAFGSIHELAPVPGSVVSWDPSPVSLDKARQAPVSAVPASNQQAAYVINCRAAAAAGRDFSFPLIISWDVAGQCDIRAMTYALNSHLRRHDTYHSWFEYTDAEEVVRHTFSEPTDIEVAPTVCGDMAPNEWRRHIVAYPNPPQWACFRFMIIQRADHFTFCACVDHIYIDFISVGVAFAEIHMVYANLVDGERPIRLAEVGSYEDYCVRQRAYTSTLTSESPEIRRWIEFAENNGGTLPECPLPLGDASASWDSLGAQLLDDRQTPGFESACVAAGARFSGGVFACAALAQYELTGAATYSVMTSVDNRSTPTDFRTAGWFSDPVPITVPITVSSFAETARAAQASFDSGKDQANVLFGQVLALAPWLRSPQRSAPTVFFFDVGLTPLAALLNSQMDAFNVSVYHVDGFGGDFNLRFFRLEKETQVIVQFPDNPVARDSVTRFLIALKSAFARVADGHGALPLPAQGTGVVGW